MDGIFGVGITEMIIIALVLFVVGGPENTAKWARQAGRFVRQMREMWAEFMKDIESELGPEGKELMDVTRELGQGAADLRRSTSPRRLLSESARAMDALVRDDAPPARPPVSASAATPAEPSALESPAPGGDTPTEAATRYRAWQPPGEQS
ncbi:MAG: twin-arginine translocase TatA/TatE family subunit [Anaerolineae bacterium]|nr:twin-arginine translocase TatA/TatE family subunit [Anaerolineae bacterium]